MDTLRGIFQAFNPDVKAHSSAKAFDTAARNYAASVTTNLPPAARAAILQQPLEAIQVCGPPRTSLSTCRTDNMISW
jgi:COP9 signalosome complex subunit 3